VHPETWIVIVFNAKSSVAGGDVYVFVAKLMSETTTSLTLYLNRDVGVILYFVDVIESLIVNSNDA
jgi:hypothetical protein